MEIKSLVGNDLVLDESGVYVLMGHTAFSYSDGAESERYLTEVLSRASDLTTKSVELEAKAKDWASEYHLTTKRAQLLEGFTFDRSMRVLEVGCGCGAITRSLGEKFDRVISVEGSIHRARIARLRTRDLPGVSIVCSPFQKVLFLEKFDIVFCIGVFEYSASFIDGEDPYAAAVDYFDSILSPSGILVVAIENQFGLKYFASVREDHVGRSYEGIEGYHRKLARVRTFGRAELDAMLRRRFSRTEFLYPYPDYKLPSAIFSEKFLSSGHASEVASQISSRDYFGSKVLPFNESFTTLELGKNGALPFFANSFLVIASKADSGRWAFDQHAVLYSPLRNAALRTVSRVTDGPEGRMLLRKQLVNGENEARVGPLTWRATQTAWINGSSLQTVLLSASRAEGARIDDVFSVCMPWIAALQRSSQGKGDKLPPSFLDAIWSNSYIVEECCEFVDLEWVWCEELPLSTVVIRAIYYFLVKRQEFGALPLELRGASGRRMISDIARAMGVLLTPRDFADFVELEAIFQESAYGVPRSRTNIWIRWFLLHPASLRVAVRQRLLWARVWAGFLARTGLK